MIRVLLMVACAALASGASALDNVNLLVPANPGGGWNLPASTATWAT